jgi:hypothetical protein
MDGWGGRTTLTTKEKGKSTTEISLTAEETGTTVADVVSAD